MNGSMRPVRRLALMMVLVAAACGGDSSEDEVPQTEATPDAVVLQPTDIAVVQPTRITGGIVLAAVIIWPSVSLLLPNLIVPQMMN